LAFFDLPLAERMKIALPHPGYPYGYAPLTSETLTKSLGEDSPPDLKEGFAAGPLKVPDRQLDDEEAGFVYAPNLWPENPSGLRPAFKAYVREMDALAQRLMRLFALALDLPRGFFTPMINEAISACRANHYPALENPPAAGQLRAGAHSDYGSLTILLPHDTPGGLQVQTRTGDWINAPVIPGTFIINIGDLMARWTNDRWVSTLHRVVTPPLEAGAQSRRLSIAFFHQPNWHADITCLPSCLAQSETPLYEPVKSGPYLMEKFTSTVM
ncbi:MAG: isopenicillin N synthase family oxygenase, partial [Alphaproteobacteria bacterium]|nr:isopenicillin N synthase family oxygenase [Alphaproteobacteria bacterium]